MLVLGHPAQVAAQVVTAVTGESMVCHGDAAAAGAEAISRSLGLHSRRWLMRMLGRPA